MHSNDTHGPGGGFLLYGLNNSWYTAKLRPYLRFKGIRFVEKKPNIWTWYVTIARRFGNPTVPVLVTPAGEWWQDTSVIIDRLEGRYPDKAVVPREPVQKLVSYLFELWGDEFWHGTGVYWRWKYPENYPIWEEEMSRAFLPGLPFTIQRQVAKVASKQMAAHLPHIGATPEQIPLLERWSEQQLDLLDAHFAAQPFLLGTRPSLGDFGLMGPLWGHLGYDPGTRRRHIDHRPHLLAWMQRMNALDARSPAGDFLPDDAIAPTLLPLLHGIFAEMLPYLTASADDVAAAVPRLTAGERLPRMLGEAAFPLLGERFARRVIPYTVWMTQRLLDLLPAMSAGDEARARDWLAAQGGEALLRLRIPRLRQAGLQAAPEWRRNNAAADIW